mmetsp:Transcript_7994/g.11254  ORF Transcript_7994/g.11254 Transcript_7994/m.11254 type:complete len:212 (-) Transcript_7994:225-860(-)
MSWCDFSVSSGTSCTNQGLASSTETSSLPPAEDILSPMPDSECKFTQSLICVNAISPLYVSLISALAPRCMRMDGNFLILNLLTTSSSDSAAKPNFTVRLKTVSLERALKSVAGVFCFENKITFGFVGSVVRNWSTFSLVSLVLKSGISLDILPEMALVSNLPSYKKAGMGFVGYSMTAGVSLTLFFSQNAGQSVQLIAHTLAMPLRSLAI